MADFVGLLKKTIEAQSQMTPRLRQRIYGRARATVERKLAESQAPLPVMERQREVLNQAINEVEAHYQEQDRQAIAASMKMEHGAAANLVDGISTPSPQSTDKQQDAVNILNNTPTAPQAPIVSNLEKNTPPPVIAATPTPQRQQLLAPALTTITPPLGFFTGGGSASPAQTENKPESVSTLSARPPAEPIAILEENASVGAVASTHSPVPLSTKPNIPSLATFLNAEKRTDGQDPSSPPPPDLPFLKNNNAKEEPQANIVPTPLPNTHALNDSVAPQNPTPVSAASVKQTVNQPILSVQLVSPHRKPPQPTGSQLLQPRPPQPQPVPQQPSPLSPSVQRSPLLGDYLPHWSENEEPPPPPAFSSNQAAKPVTTPILPPFPTADPLSTTGNVKVSARANAQSEIDKARREIEALRDDRSVLDELPFSMPDDVPWEPSDQTDIDLSLSKSEDKTSHAPEGNFDHDPMSEIFVQAARREQEQSGRKRRVAAMVISLIVVAILAAIVGILVLTNEYQFGGESGSTGQEAEQNPTSSLEDGANSELAAAEIDSVENGSAKITRRLLPGGQETDPGSAVDAARPGEGNSQAPSSLTPVDNGARAVFYEAPTEALSATANEGRVEWRLRRTPATASNPQPSSEQDSNQDVAIIGDVNIPSLGITLRLTLRYNDDETMPADYLTEIIFAVPDDFEGEAIDDIGPLMFKASEQSTGQELAGMTTAKVQDNLFLMAVRAPRPILDRNLALMRQLPWLKLNVLYKNGRVGEFSIAKGEGGNRIFQQAIDEWSRRANTSLSGSMTLQEPVLDLSSDSPQNEQGDETLLENAPAPTSDNQN